MSGPVPQTDATQNTICHAAVHTPARVHNPMGQVREKPLLSGKTNIEKEPVTGMTDAEDQYRWFCCGSYTHGRFGLYGCTVVLLELTDRLIAGLKVPHASLHGFIWHWHFCTHAGCMYRACNNWGCCRWFQVCRRAEKHLMDNVLSSCHGLPRFFHYTHLKQKDMSMSSPEFTHPSRMSTANLPLRAAQT